MGQRKRNGSSHLLLRLDSALQKRLNPTLKVLHLLPLKPIQLIPHQPPHILKQPPGLRDLPLRLRHVRLDLAQPILLAPPLPQQLLQAPPPLLHLRLGGVPRVEGPLPLLEGLLDGPDEPDVLLDDDAERQHVLLRLAVVDVADSELQV